jgi:glucuronate isomerase
MHSACWNSLEKPEENTMKTFIHEDFLLASKPARILYHDHAEKMPIYDYHCHLNPMEILENRQFDSIAQAWLGGDHYKWRLMRAHGVAEQYITGGAPDRDKFRKWAEILPLSFGNPIYHLSHL